MSWVPSVVLLCLGTALLLIPRLLPGCPRAVAYAGGFCWAAFCVLGLMAGLSLDWVLAGTLLTALAAGGEGGGKHAV